MNGTNPLETTAVHPESYEVAEKLLKAIGYNKSDLLNKETLTQIKEKLKTINVNEMAQELEVGELTLKDIIAEISKPRKRSKRRYAKTNFTFRCIKI